MFFKNTNKKQKQIFMVRAQKETELGPPINSRVTV